MSPLDPTNKLNDLAEARPRLSVFKGELPMSSLRLCACGCGRVIVGVHSPSIFDGDHVRHSDYASDC